MAIAPDFLDEIRARVGLGDVIARHVSLRRAGRELTGLCPFHNEKTPSFTVSEEKGFFHCFGCGAHGDVIGFVMRQEGLSFPEAVERLAGEAGLEVPKATPEEREAAKRAATLHDVMERACRFFEDELQGPRGVDARSYFARRGIDEETRARFRLGYAPDSKTGLRNAVMDGSHPEALLVEAGLLIRPDNGTPYDRFRGRVIFPIADRRGRVIAFGGRLLGDGKPKYLNSPDTPLFSKGRVLYGMATAREAAHRNGRVIVTEGYTDVIALNRAGFAESVAPLGTALTESHLHALWRMAPEPVLCFDGDAAGKRAAYRAAERAVPLLEPGRSLQFVTLPPGRIRTACSPTVAWRRSSPAWRAGGISSIWSGRCTPRAGASIRRNASPALSRRWSAWSTGSTTARSSISTGRTSGNASSAVSVRGGMGAVGTIPTGYGFRPVRRPRRCRAVPSATSWRRCCATPR